MRLTCFITVCAYLSSTESADEIRYLNRIKRARSQEEFAIKNVAVEKEINSRISETYPDISSVALQKSQPQVRIETFQRPKRTHESQSGLQEQQQHHRYNRGHSRRLTRHLKTRSIAGTSTYELDDNELKDLSTISEAPDDESIRIEPVLRVHKQKNIFDSIIDIVRQLINPSKNELGPLVGPIQMPGSARKIYLRLIEPIDANQVIVRFVTQVPVPVIDVEPKQEIIPLPPFIDVADVKQHPVLIHDTMFGSSNRHHSIHLPKNVSFKQVSSKNPGSQSLKNPLKDLQGTDKESVSLDKDEAAKGAENGKNHFADASNSENHDQFLGESGYKFQSEKEAVNEVKALFNDTTVMEDDGSKGSFEPWYQLTTHRLPLRQIAPLYPLALMEHSDPGSYADTYKVPNDVPNAPDSYSSSYERYNNANPTPNFYDNSHDQRHAPDSYSMSYSKQNDIQTTPSTYSTAYQKPNEFDSVSNSHSISYNKQNDIHATPNTYSISYQTQNEFNNAPSSYSILYQNQNKFNNVPSSYPTPYEKENDLSSSFSSYSNSYAKPDVSPSSSSYVTSHQNINNIQITPSNSYATSYKKPNSVQTSSSFHDALQVIDPPTYFPGYPKSSENHVNRSFERTAYQKSHYNYPHNVNEMSSNIGQNSVSLLGEVIWGSAMREKSESSFPKNAPIFPEMDDNRERWQPITFVREDADWHKAFKVTDPAKIAVSTGRHETKQQPLDHSKKTSRPATSMSSTDRKRLDQRQTGKRRDAAATARSPRCSSSKEDACERTRPVVAPTLHSEEIIKIVEKQTQSITNAEPIVATTPKLATNNMVETFGLDVTKNPMSTSTISTVSSITERSLVITTKNSVITERPPLLIKMIKSPLVSGTMERLVVNKATDRPTISNITEKSVANSTTKKLSTHGTTEVPVSTVSTVKKLQLPKRPMLMKKPMFIMKGTGSSSTTTQKSTTSGTTKATTKKRSKFQGAIPKKGSITT